jgi:hypothetical protein
MIAMNMVAKLNIATIVIAGVIFLAFIAWLLWYEKS